MMKKVKRTIALITVLLTTLSLAGCDGNVGIGMSVGVPVGSHGRVSVGGTRWL
jgi:predicted small secreted protein